SQFFHAAKHVELRGFAVHVPAGVVDRDESAACLAESSCQQELLSQRRRAVLLESRSKAGGVVARYYAWVFSRQIEGRALFAKNDVERLLLELVQRVDGSVGVDRARNSVECGEERTAVFQAAGRDMQCQIAVDLTAASERERGAAAAQLSCAARLKEAQS